MRKSLLLIATAVLAMTACTQDVPENEGGAIAIAGEVNVSATIDENTRTSMTVDGDNLSVSWVAGDGIGMFATDGSGSIGDNVKYTAASNDATSKFTKVTEAIKWGEGTHNFYAYYPYADASSVTAVPISVPAVQEQSEAGNLDHLQPYAFLYAGKTGVSASSSVVLNFKNALSVLEVNLCTARGTINCEGIIFRAEDNAEVVSTEGATIDITNGTINTASATNSNEIKVELTTPATLDASTPQTFYMMITPGHAGKRFDIYAVVDGEEVLLGNKGIPAGGLPAGVKASLDLNVPAIDLSANGTANSYIVNKAGATYKFKATVKGNGATANYTWSGGGNNMTKTITEADVTIAPVSAKLLWTTNSATNTVVTDVELQDGYIEFKTPASFIDGNCVIAAMDGSGEILWSWHIWAVENYNDVAAAKPIKSLSVMLMDRNLGATKGVEQADPTAQSDVAGLKYQWGRKDPFPAPAGNMTWGDAGNGGKGKEHYSPDGSISYYTYALNDPSIDDEANAEDKTLYRFYNSNHGMQQLQAGTFDNNFDAAVAQSIKEPWRYHMGYTNAFGGNDNPYIYSYLWGNPTGSAGEGTKSIYDPCPVGWKVASTAVIDAMTGGSPTYLNYGMLCGDHYMPRTGRGDFASTWSWYGDCTGYGYLWSDKCYSGYGYGTACVFTMTEDTKTIGYAGKYGTTGFAVRCVSEGTVDMSNLVVDLSANGTSNCYIVNTANELYKFKATVKGNGVAAMTTDNTSIAPTKARLLWTHTGFTHSDSRADNDWPVNTGGTDADKLISASSVELKDGYIHFATGTMPINGNAVIIATDDDDNVIWSWHLWCLKGYNPAVEDYYVTAHNINTYMMDRHLGATADPGDVATPTMNEWQQSRGLYYQWGRKDPFLAEVKFNGYAPIIALFDKDNNYTTGYAVYGGSPLFKSVDLYNEHQEYTTAQIVDYSAANPMTFIKGDHSGNGYMWVSHSKLTGATNEWGKLWGNQSAAAKGGIKTMYDPCPAGYRVPSTGHFKFIVANSQNVGASSYPSHKWRNYEYNCVEVVFGDNAEALLGNANNNIARPYGLNFYVKGLKAMDESIEDGTAQNYGTPPADETTAYFPAQGIITRTFSPYGQSYNEVIVHTNAPAKNNEGTELRTRLMKATSSGDFYYDSASCNYDQQAKAVPVRCIRE